MVVRLGFKKNLNAPRPYEVFKEFFFKKKNLNPPRPSEHPPVWGKLKKNLLFLTFGVLVANLYTVANPAHGLLSEQGKKRTKEKVCQRNPPPPPPPHAARSDKIK